MKSTSRILYIIGCIGSVLAVLIGLILILVGNFTIQNAADVMNQTNQQATTPVTEAEVKALGQGMLTFGIIVAVLSAIAVIIAIIAILAFKKGRIQNAPHIIMIVIGILDANLFFLIGGILGVLAQKDEAAAQ